MNLDHSNLPREDSKACFHRFASTWQRALELAADSGYGPEAYGALLHCVVWALPMLEDSPGTLHLLLRSMAARDPRIHYHPAEEERELDTTLSEEAKQLLDRLMTTTPPKGG